MLKYKTINYSGTTYADLPVLPDYSDYDYLVLPWLSHYNWTWLADTLYGNIEMAKDLMLVNEVIDPWQDMKNKTIKIPRSGF